MLLLPSPWVICTGKLQNIHISSLHCLKVGYRIPRLSRTEKQQIPRKLTIFFGVMADIFLGERVNIFLLFITTIRCIYSNFRTIAMLRIMSLQEVSKSRTVREKMLNNIPGGKLKTGERNACVELRLFTGNPFVSQLNSFFF